VQNDDEMRQQPSHDLTENKAKVPLTKRVAIGREMPRSEGAYSAKRTKKVTNDQPTPDKPGMWFPEHSPLGCRFEVLPYPPKHDAGNEEEGSRCRTSSLG